MKAGKKPTMAATQLFRNNLTRI